MKPWDSKMLDVFDLQSVGNIFCYKDGNHLIDGCTQRSTTSWTLIERQVQQMANKNQL